MPPASNPKDHVVVTFHNKTDFVFTPQLGCMYDSRPINGKKASLGENPLGGIDAGESMQLPYHIGNQLATNLAKIAITKTAPAIDQAGIPTGVPLWDEARLTALKASYLTEEYTEAKPIALTETDRLMAKVAELQKFVEANVTKKDDTPPATDTTKPTVYQDKAEVIAELTKREIKFDARKNKGELEKLLA